MMEEITGLGRVQSQGDATSKSRKQESSFGHIDGLASQELRIGEQVLKVQRMSGIEM